MATSSRPDWLIDDSIPDDLQCGVESLRRRRVGTKAGRALEILGHAIEYLIDEHVHEGGTFTANDGRIDAVQLLMAANRSIYEECPAVPTFTERCLSFLGVDRV